MSSTNTMAKKSAIEPDATISSPLVAEIIDVRATLIDGYKQHVLEHGHQPASIYKFVSGLGLAETDYYEHFNSFEAIEGEIWLQLHLNTLIRLDAEDAYLGYTVREKWLAYFYTLIEEWKQNRSFLSWSLRQNKPMMPGSNACLKHWKEAFVAYANARVTEGTDTGEVASRPYITTKYASGLWIQALFLLDFWLKDTSQNFELTDAAVEKAINVSMDVMGSNALDSAFDFAKFVWQNK